MPIPIVFIHRGYSDYMEYSLRQARAAVPDGTEIFLLGDRNNDRFDFVNHVDMEPHYRETAGKGVRKTEIVRGPNIAMVPKGQAMAEAYSAVCAIKVGDKITTDHIMPAGARLKFRSNVPQYAKFVFEPCDPQFHDKCLANVGKGLVNVIVAGESYGQGSSREHAALCPMYLGVKAVIAKSIERIHRANLINFGIVPLVFDNPKDYDALDAGERLEIVGIRAAVEGDGKVAVKRANGKTFTASASLSAREKHLLLCGGLLASLK